MEARRAWVEAVAEAMTADGQDLIKVADELRREVEDEMQQPVDPWHNMAQRCTCEPLGTQSAAVSCSFNSDPEQNGAVHC